MMTDTKTRLLEVIRRYVVNSDEMAAVEMGQPFLSATSLDSLAMLTVIVEIEKAFDTRFDLDTLEQTFETLDTIAAYLAQATSR
jgi:acyl carrier protein